MADLFKPSLDSIIAKALQMLARADGPRGADVIVLVGGFSSSHFAMRYLRAALEVPGRPVVAPSYRRSAVIEGESVGGRTSNACSAVMVSPSEPCRRHCWLLPLLTAGGVWFSRYPSAIAARCSNMTYGVRTATPWRPGAPSKVSCQVISYVRLLPCVSLHASSRWQWASAGCVHKLLCTVRGQCADCHSAAGLPAVMHVASLQSWLTHKQAYRCLDGFCRYVAKDELIKSGSVISKTFFPLYPNQTGVVFDIYGCLQENAR